MNISRRGKIARLPEVIRAEVNRRLDEGETGKAVVAWLNTLPEVRKMVVGEFGGQPVTEQNLSQWRKGGYRDWQRLREAMEVTRKMATEMEEAPQTGRQPPTEVLARWIAVRYAIAMKELQTMAPAEAWPRLREMCADVSALRRADHAAQRLELERQRRPQRRTEAIERPMPTRTMAGEGPCGSHEPSSGLSKPESPTDDLKQSGRGYAAGTIRRDSGGDSPGPRHPTHPPSRRETAASRMATEFQTWEWPASGALFPEPPSEEIKVNRT